MPFSPCCRGSARHVGEPTAGGELACPAHSDKWEAQRLARQLVPATSGTARLALAASQSVTLDTTSVHLVPTGIWGPIGNNMHALLIGQFFVLPGVIDSEFEGEIQIMLWTPVPPCSIPAGQRLAQLVPFASTTPGEKLSVALVDLAALASLKFFGQVLSQQLSRPWYVL